VKPLSPEQAADLAEIAQALQRYGRALDHKDYALMESVFAPGARLHYRMGDGRRSEGDLAHWVEVFRSFMADFWWTSHLIGPPAVELHADAARSTCQLIATHVQMRHDGSRNRWTVWGFYRDQLVRTASGWRIRERSFEGVHAEGELLPKEAVRSFPESPYR
jgi:hypothetical protein